MGIKGVFTSLLVMAVSLLFYVGMALPETRIVLANDRAQISSLKVVRRLLISPKIWVYGLLISGVNGILFSYYAETSFILIDHFKLTAVQYG